MVLFCHLVIDDAPSASANAEDESANEVAIAGDAVAAPGKYHQLAVELVMSGNGDSGEGNASGAASTVTFLSDQDVKFLVGILEKIHDPTASKGQLSLFMASVQKFAFGKSSEQDNNSHAEQEQVYARLRGLTASAEDEAFVTRLAQLPVSEWKV